MVNQFGVVITRVIDKKRTIVVPQGTHCVRVIFCELETLPKSKGKNISNLKSKRKEHIKVIITIKDLPVSLRSDTNLTRLFKKKFVLDQ